MASIGKDVMVGAPAQLAWDALRDFGAVHQRVAPGFVVDAEADRGDRLVTFASGARARGPVAIDDERRRLVYTVVDGPLGAVHHQASVEVVAADEGRGGCRLVWISDVLSDELAVPIEGMMEQGSAAIAAALTP